VNLGTGYYSLVGVITLVIGVIAFVIEVYSLIDAVRQRPDAFTAAGKLTKPIWLGILGVATAIGVISLLTPFGLISLIAFVAAGVYLADVRPALRSISGGGGSNGPYGRW
jgi:branched-subunit amino acid transport protein AzlD